ncbi:MAG: hypothetical protein E7175_03715 [Erysipelotrichaceae bacterium]|nr:hypothetical protein [Erysipelotrichaceae bacterium]
MKFPIKFKIVALGAVLSILVTTVAIVFADQEYRRRGRENELNNIDNWLSGMKEDYSTQDDDGFYPTLIKTRSYIEECYASYPDDPPEDFTFEEKKNFYKTYFNWLYPIEGIAMHYQTPEEMQFRSDYEELAYSLSDTKSATKASSAYIAYLLNDDTLMIIGDEYSYKKGKAFKEEARFPGSQYHGFDGVFTLNGDYYDCNYNNKLNRVMVINDTDGNNIAYLFIQYDFVEVDSDANSLLKTEIIVLSISSIVMIIAYALGAHFLLIRNVSKLTKSAASFSNDLKEGKPLEKKDPHVKSRDEISLLSESFVSLEEDIIKYIDVIQKEAYEKEKDNAELNVANSIQLGALPSHIYDDKNVNIRAFIKSAKQIGGDFYDYFYLDDNRLAVVISDVSGKGIPAALFMMKSKELIKSTIRSYDNLEEVAKIVNDTLVNSDKESLFVTSFIGIIDFKKNVIAYVNAGHEKPYIVSKDKVTKLDGESNFVMGGEADFIYKQESHPFKKGDYIFLFTDGLNESINHTREEFSYERIEKTLYDNRDLAIDNIIDVMNNKLEEFVGDVEQFDDVTMLVVKNNDHKLHLSYDKKEYEIISDIVDRFNEYYSYLGSETKAAAGVVIDELINNLVSYETRLDLKIDVDFNLGKDVLEIVISSNGNDYNPFINHQEKYVESFDPEMDEGGFGLSIIKDLASSYDYKYEDEKSITIVRIKL